MQLDIFSMTTPQAVDLRKTTLPELSEAVAQVGTAQQWATLTLSQVLELWDQLYTDFVAVLDAPIHHAKIFCRQDGQQHGEGGPLARKFYQREYQRLLQGQHQLRATIENAFCGNLIAIIAQGKELMQASGMSETAAEDSHEFFNEVIQRPQPHDLDKLMPALMRDLAEEYLRLEP